MKYLLVLLTLSCLISTSLSAQEFDWEAEIMSLARPDLLPTYRQGTMIGQVSSYDTTGGNDDGFNGTYSYIRKEEDGLVLADFDGPGVINRIWTPTPTADTLKFYFDGNDEPGLVIRFEDLFSGQVYPFLRPMSGNEIGGFYTYFPIPFAKSCKIVFTGEKIMFHQIQYRMLPGQSVSTYTEAGARKLSGAIEEVNAIWDIKKPQLAAFPNAKDLDYQTTEKTIRLTPGESGEIFDKSVPGRIVGLELKSDAAFTGLEKDLVLQATWDGESTKAIDVPVADFFGYAYGTPSMRGMLMGSYDGFHYCYLPFPYDEKANIAVKYHKRAGTGQVEKQFTAVVHWVPEARDKVMEGKFYASWRREIEPENGEYYTFANLKGAGHYVGTTFLTQGLKAEMTLFFEGDDSTRVDGKMTIHGTGSEDYFNGGWYAIPDRWDKGISLPIHGSLDYSVRMARTGGYRFYLSDKIPFEEELYMGIEHGPEGNSYPVDYTSVAYYYSDSPLGRAGMVPEGELLSTVLPKEHTFYPELVDVQVNGSLAIERKRGVQMTCSPDGQARFELDGIPEGMYEVYLSYFEKPDGADFEVWQRQQRVSDWISSKKPEEKLVKDRKLGEVYFTAQTSTLTFHVKEGDGASNHLEIKKIYLVRKE
ncbi:glycoside hydrolase family 172 protein [Echinicola rosea]|uniref:DUF2961 domain-containing protein n=1 Tax=Echinicola rosea TaxID=1807691 RepID=A0ABQ1US92_9BACT|nr:glycoside hydrolase family 172 protein [Echinicola rosea]GGF25471.1 hypothetical protein GCM10011339_11960 [Echinicola rosea]